MCEGLTVASSVGTDRYDEEAERLDWSVAKLTEQHKKMYTACSKYKKHMTQQHFDYIASNYEGMYLKMGYPDPKYVSNWVTKFAEKNKQDLSKV